MRHDQAEPSDRRSATHSADLEARYKTVGVRAVAAAAPYCKGERRNDERKADAKRDTHDFGPLCSD